MKCKDLSMTTYNTDAEHLPQGILSFWFTIFKVFKAFEHEW